MFDSLSFKTSTNFKKCLNHEMTNFSDIYQDFPIVGVVFSRATDCVCVTLYWLKSNNEDQFLFLIINILSLGKMIYAKICAEIMPSGRTIFFQVKGRVKSPAATNSHWHLIKLAHSLCSARPFDTIYGTWSRKITMFCQMFLKA